MGTFRCGGRLYDEVYDARSFPGIRFFPGLGVRGGGKTWEDDASFAQDLYDRFAAPRERRYFLTTPRNWFVAEKKFPWREVLVDESRPPASHAQARDPDWDNYKWNRTDIVANMLTGPAIAQGKAKLSLVVALTATSEPDPVPRWIKKAGLTWTDGDGRVHVRQDLTEGWSWMADFLVALVRRYGDDPRVATLVIGEYYPSDKGRPADFDFDALRANAKNIWTDVISNAPTDARGNRLNIVQSNPIMTGGIVKTADIAELKLGVSGSDPYIFVGGCGRRDGSPCDAGTHHRTRQDLYGIVPLQHQGNAAVFRRGLEVAWTGIANPFGYTAGQVVPLQLQHIAWYFGSKGVIPLNSLIIKDHVSLTEDWFPTFDRFGPNGKEAAAWGHLPQTNRMP